MSSSLGHKHQNGRFPKASSIAFLFVRKRNPMLFAFDACFTKQRGCGATKFAKVHIAHHVLKDLNTLHVQMARRQCQRSRTPFAIPYCTKLAVSAPCTFTKLISYNFHLRGAMTMASPLQYLTIHLFRLNLTLNHSIRVCSPRTN